MSTKRQNEKASKLVTKKIKTEKAQKNEIQQKSSLVNNKKQTKQEKSKMTMLIRLANAKMSQLK